MNGDEIVKTGRVVLFTDIHNFSIATQVLAERQYSIALEKLSQPRIYSGCSLE